MKASIPKRLITFWTVLALGTLIFPACNNSDRPVGPESGPSFTPQNCTGVLGDSTIETSSGPNSDQIVANKYSFSGGTLTSLALYTSGIGQFRMAIYSDNGAGAPVSLLGQSAAVSTVSSPGWNSAPLSLNLPSGTYWLALQVNASVSIYFTGNGTSLPFIDQSFGAFPGNYSGYSACSCSVISMIANYCP